MGEKAIKFDHVSKDYRIGTIGGGTLYRDLQSWWARIRGKEDPNSIIGKDVNIKNEKFRALNDISLEVKKGEALGIIGHNGAGKSTLLKLLSRVTAPTQGTLYINGRIASMLEVGTGFHPEMTGRENIYMNGAILGMSRKEINRKIDDIIEFSECLKFIDTPVKRYSSGMYVKLAFAVAAHLDNEILIMDEVLAVGDMKFQQKCLEKMRYAAAKEGRTVFYVSHNMNTIRQLCNRCIVLNKGNIIFDSDTEAAIELYLGQHGEMSLNNNLSEITRPQYLNQRIEMMQLSVLNKSNLCFKSNEKLVFNLKWNALCDVSNIALRMIFRYRGQSTLGMATTLPVFCADKDEIKSNIFEVDLSCFAQGRYVAELYFYERGYFGDYDNYDVVVGALNFEIEQDVSFTNSLRWHHEYWGHGIIPIKQLGGVI